MALHFTEQELSDRRQAAIEAITAGGLDGLLMFRQESMYYLTGYDSFGFVFFQCLYLGADGTLTLLTRAPDLRQAQHTSVISDIRIWIDKADATPAQQLRTILDEHRCRGQRLGIELEAYGLTGRSLRMVDAALDGFCELVDASELISRLRVVKSQAELAYVERAAELADAALAEACEKTEPGADEAEILQPRCTERFFAAAAITRATNSLSVPGRMRCCAATSVVVVDWTPMINLPWNLPAPIGATTLV